MLSNAKNLILIVTVKKDMHALMVEYCLKRCNFEVVSIATDDLLSKGLITFEIGAGAESLRYADSFAEFSFDAVSCVWFRRFADPKLVKSDIHVDDLSNAQRGATEFSKQLFGSISRDAVWINPIDSIPRSCSKFAQLIEAKKLGMKIPETLISNDSSRIKNFVAGRTAIHKSMIPMRWIEDGKLFAAATSSISGDDLPSKRILQLAPGIYQERVDKRSDLRIVFFGEEHIGIRLGASENPLGYDDIRVVKTELMNATLFELDQSTYTACLAFMRSFEMVFACFDFLEDENGDLVFLEVNPGGQFLWMEEVVPETKLLQRFLSFLTRGEYAKQINFTETFQSKDFQQWLGERVN